MKFPPFSLFGSVFSFLTLAVLCFLATVGLKPRQDGFIVSVDELPKQIGDWTGEDTVGLGLRELNVLKLDKYLRRVYTKSTGEKILVYVGYWGKQSGDHQAAKHSPATCLPANGWNTFGYETRTIEGVDMGDGINQVSVNRVLGDFKRQKKVFYYWFFTGKDHYYKDWQSLLRISWRNAIGKRSDGGIIDLTADIEGETFNAEEAEALLEDFIRDFLPVLQSKIRETEL